MGRPKGSSKKSADATIFSDEKVVDSVESPDLEKKVVEVQQKTPQDQIIEKNDDLKNHPKFAKFKAGELKND